MQVVLLFQVTLPICGRLLSSWKMAWSPVPPAFTSSSCWSNCMVLWVSIVGNLYSICMAGLSAVLHRLTISAVAIICNLLVSPSGAFGPSPALYDGMDIKHVQHDAIGWGVLRQAPSDLPFHVAWVTEVFVCLGKWWRDPLWFTLQIYTQ